MMNTAPVALTIAGSDSSAGAGIQADLKTFSAFGVYGVCAVTCVVAETPGRVARIEPVSARSVREQIDVLLANFPVAAAKTGLLHSAEIVREVADVFRAAKLPLVVDPVMIATSGDPLLNSDAVECYERELLPLATLITPNIDEAQKLSGIEIRGIGDVRAAGSHLVAKYGVSVLLKGGHLSGDSAIDLLFCGPEIAEFSAPFSRDVATHGTGCTYSAAIAANVALGQPLADAVQRAKAYVTRAIANHFRWQLGANAVDALNHSV